MSPICQATIFLIVRAEQKWNNEEGVSAYSRETVAELLSSMVSSGWISRVEMAVILGNLETKWFSDLWD
jgi:hypothetical protein